MLSWRDLVVLWQEIACIQFAPEALQRDRHSLSRARCFVHLHSQTHCFLHLHNCTGYYCFLLHSQRFHQLRFPKRTTLGDNLQCYTVFHTKRSKNCVFEILLHILGINCPTVMLQVSLWSPILTEHHGSYGFLSGDTHVTQNGGIYYCLEWKFRLGFPKLLVVKVW